MYLLTIRCPSTIVADAIRNCVTAQMGFKYVADSTIFHDQAEHGISPDIRASERFRAYVDGFERGLQFNDAVGPLPVADRKQLIEDVLAAMRENR